MGTTRRRVARNIFFGFSAFALAGAGLAGWLFHASPMDMVLLQLTFYGAWCCLFGARVGGYLGAMMEEDCCSELDMGVLSSMGSMLGTLSAGLVGTALTGLALTWIPWFAVFSAFAVFATAHAVLGAVRPLRVVRSRHIDNRGRVLGADGKPLPDHAQPPRMPDRVGALLAVSAVVVLALTMVMAVMMGSDLGHPVMMAPMMYGMFGTMIGGMLGGWLAGLLDEHEGHPDHDNPVMVSAMALMAGMMGGMPSGMIGGMMAIMGMNAIVLSAAGGIIIAGFSWTWVMRGRYGIATEPGHAVSPAVPLPLPRAPNSDGNANLATKPPPAGEGVPMNTTTILVQGMSCAACVHGVTKALSRLDGIARVEVELASGTAKLEHVGTGPDMDAVRRALDDAGYALGGPA